MTISEILATCDSRPARTNSDLMDSLLTQILDSAPTQLDTLKELATALNNDENFATNITNLIGTKLAKNSDISAGTATKVTYDTKGLIVSSSNPTTLAGYGITDATPSSHIGSTGIAHGVATHSVNGFMSSSDKTKLDTFDTNELLWLGSNKTISTLEPTANDGTDGDIWFTYES
jgi:hypothetical protein